MVLQLEPMQPEQMVLEPEPMQPEQMVLQLEPMQPEQMVLEPEPMVKKDPKVIKVYQDSNHPLNAQQGRDVMPFHGNVCHALEHAHQEIQLKNA
jgi:hypothetical protein